MKKLLLLLLCVPLIFSCGKKNVEESYTNEGVCVAGDCKNGIGTFIYNDGDRYEGEWNNGERNGQGTLFFPKGEKYVGEFKDDLAHGIGTLTYKEKTIIGRIFGRFQTKEGLWENGEPIHQNN